MNPSWGLFLQPDTLIKNAYNPQALNRYMFELGNPYRYTDPTGHEFIEADESQVGGLAGIGEEAWRVWSDIETGRSWNYPEMVATHNEYYHGSFNKEFSDDSYNQLREWGKVRGFDTNIDSSQPVSLERSSLISTKNTFSTSSVYSQLYGISSGNFYDKVGSFGGTVTVRNEGVKVGVLSVYSKLDKNGNTVLRYQVHTNEKSKKQWEKEHKTYKPYKPTPTKKTTKR